MLRISPILFCLAAFPAFAQTTPWQHDVSGGGYSFTDCETVQCVTGEFAGTEQYDVFTKRVRPRSGEPVVRVDDYATRHVATVEDVDVASTEYVALTAIAVDGLTTADIVEVEAWVAVRNESGSAARYTAEVRRIPDNATVATWEWGGTKLPNNQATVYSGAWVDIPAGDTTGYRLLLKSSRSQATQTADAVFSAAAIR